MSGSSIFTSGRMLAGYNSNDAHGPKDYTTVAQYSAGISIRIFSCAMLSRDEQRVNGDELKPASMSHRRQPPRTHACSAAEPDASCWLNALIGLPFLHKHLRVDLWARNALASANISAEGTTYKRQKPRDSRHANQYWNGNKELKTKPLVCERTATCVGQREIPLMCIVAGIYHLTIITNLNLQSMPDYGNNWAEKPQPEV
jgi:hypothetical protein